MNIYFSLVITLVLSVMNCSAQDIPNGDFESWIWIGGWFENPEGWTTLNNQVLISAVNETEACEGSGSLFLQPIAATESIMGIASVEFPITSIPAQLHFCAKSNIATNEGFIDTCRVIISFWNGAVEFYSEEWVNTESIEEWTEFSIPLNQIEPVMDGGKIEIQASYQGIGLGSGDPATWIAVDHLRFDTPNSILENEVRYISIYPNPSEDGVIHLESDSKLGIIEVYDLLGNLIHRTQEPDKKTVLTLNQPAGFYTLKVGSISRKLILK